ncbi:DUF2666 family protein [Candidatus Micrarchaeota archaeon]|nr:DUF2666 family protein [Candidatus Micrarchaeota archaeon]
MYGSDEIVFTGKYKDFSLGVHYDLSKAAEKDVAGILTEISEGIEPFAYAFSGINTEEICQQAKVSGSGIEAVAKAVEQSDFGKWVKQKYAKEMRPVAESYYFNRLLANAGVKIRPETQNAIKPTKEDFGGTIAFVGKYKDWIAIKKLGLENVKDYEVSGILAGINFTIVNKSLAFAGFEGDASSITKGKRKSYGAAVECLREIENPEPHIVCRVLEELGFRPYASSHMLTDAYPDIKPPKVKGRKPKK